LFTGGRSAHVLGAAPSKTRVSRDSANRTTQRPARATRSSSAVQNEGYGGTIRQGGNDPRSPFKRRVDRPGSGSPAAQRSPSATRGQRVSPSTRGATPLRRAQSGEANRLGRIPVLRRVPDTSDNARPKDRARPNRDPMRALRGGRDGSSGSGIRRVPVLRPGSTNVPTTSRATPIRVRPLRDDRSQVSSTSRDVSALRPGASRSAIERSGGIVRYGSRSGDAVRRAYRIGRAPSVVTYSRDHARRPSRSESRLGIAIARSDGDLSVALRFGSRPRYARRHDLYRRDLPCGRGDLRSFGRRGGIRWNVSTDRSYWSLSYDGVHLRSHPWQQYRRSGSGDSYWRRGAGRSGLWSSCYRGSSSWSTPYSARTYAYTRCRPRLWSSAWRFCNPVRTYATHYVYTSPSWLYGYDTYDHYSPTYVTYVDGGAYASDSRYADAYDGGIASIGDAYADGGPVVADEAPAGVMIGGEEPAVDTAEGEFGVHEWTAPDLPEDAVDAFESGSEAFERGAFDDAREQFLLSMFAAPDHPLPPMMFAWSCFATGGYETGGMALRRALRIEPLFLTSPPDLRTMYPESFALQEHLDALGERAAEGSAPLEVRLLWAYALYATAQPEEALTVLDALAAEFPEDTTIEQFRGEAQRVVAAFGE
jgi:hypothetical protein